MNAPKRLLITLLLAAALPVQADDRQELCGAIGQLAGSAAQARDVPPDLVKALANHSCLQALTGNDQ